MTTSDKSHSRVKPRAPAPAPREVLQAYATFKRAVLSLPTLEKVLLRDLSYYSGLHAPVADCLLERRHLLISLRVAQGEIRTLYKTLSVMRRSLETADLSEKSIARKLKGILAKAPHRDRIVKQIEYIGDIRAYFKRMSFYFRDRFDRYARCIEIVKKSNQRKAFGQLSMQVAEALPETPAEPGPVHLLICILEPPACLAILLTVILVKLGYDASVDDEEPEEEGGVCEGEIEAPDEGLCYPE